MKTKEKAKELVDKYKPLVTTWDCHWDVRRREDSITSDAKQCALIVVKFAKENPLNTDGYNKYLDELKQEIETL